MANEQVITRRIQAYARRHNVGTGAVRTNTMLFAAAMMEHEVKCGDKTIDQARQEFSKRYPDTYKSGPNNVAHYIGTCNGECSNASKCPCKG